ncbi:redoxin domain-containing protein [Paraliomyxa miuraensis]|uniref:redoxin domain-containing protein n=1 Tax=Paraliomyxa miuraensis TaxID=376150 RepID=UPI002257AA3A|nr:redoxin domain-containing protein [Paraliomyxa miuraensis]MCX4245959.1 redoxin domain-containing protein [Paraliomyxa miuraensis]
MTPRILLPLALCLTFAACDKNEPKAEAPGDAKQAKGDAKGDAKEQDRPAEPAAKAPVPETSAAIGQPAPDFTLTDLDGKAHHLADYRGKTVVLEWWNPQCPFVDHAHTKGPLVDMAAKEIAQGVVWLAINSGAPGKQGHGVEASREGITRFGMTHPVLLDEDGTVGHTYGAEKTPHMFLIDEAGTLVYRGAIDNAPMGEPNEGGEPVNHLAAALAELRAGTPVGTAETPAYGCSVKYAKG